MSPFPYFFAGSLASSSTWWSGRPTGGEKLICFYNERLFIREFFIISLDVSVWDRPDEESIFTLLDLRTDKVHYESDGDDESRSDRVLMEIEFSESQVRIARKIQCEFILIS